MKKYIFKILCIVGIFIECIMGMTDIYASEIENNVSENGFKGNGDIYDPYLIESYEDLCLLRNIVDSGNGLYGKYIRQTNDIVFPENKMWNGIGEILEGYAFGGYYDGNGCTISNICCDELYAGLFSFLDGEIRNLGIESGTIRGNYVGAIASNGTSNAKIINCYNKATVIADGRAGGITDDFSGVIKYCWNLGKMEGITENTVVAGISSYGMGEISNCYILKTTANELANVVEGKLDDSYLISQNDMETYLDASYEAMWQEYLIYKDSLKWENVNDTSADEILVINRENTIFMRSNGQSIYFDKNYEPSVFAKEKQDNQEKFNNTYINRFQFDGKGTEEEPFLIQNYTDLCRLRDCVNINVPYSGYYFLQTDNIIFPDDEKWIPIGNVEGTIGFEGVYDGGGHYISNIYCENQYAGVFSYLCGEVTNLGIESGTFIGKIAGSIANHASQTSKIINCYNKAKIIGTERAGGISDNNSGLILYSYNLGKIKGEKKSTITAGICSYGSARIDYCYSVYGQDIIYKDNYKGQMNEAEVINLEDIPNKIDSGYEHYNEYIKDNIIGGSLTLLRYEDNTVSFDTDNKMQEEISDCLLKFIPILVLLLASCIFMICFATKRKEKTVKDTQKIDISVCRKFEKKNIVAIIVTLSVLFGSFYEIMRILNSETTAGIMNLENWEKEENENTDILFLGSSTMSVNIELAELWSKYGIAGYCLGAGGMSNYDSYYRLIEAEKSHPVKMVVIDARACMYSFEYNEREAIIENVSGLKYSLNKWRFVKAAAEPEDRLDYFLEFPLYHDRYNSITKWDFLHTSSLGENDKGTWTVFYGNQYSPTLEAASDVTEYYALDEKAEYYFRKTIEYCLEHDIEILIIKTPDANRTVDQKIYNTVELITDEYNVPFVNLNNYDDEIGLVSSDFYYDDNHLNVIGARKCSDFLGQYLMENYDLIDHRGEDEYKSWDLFTSNRENLYLKAITDNKDYFEELERDKKTVIAIPYKISQEDSDEYKEISKQMSKLSFETWDEKDSMFGEDESDIIEIGTSKVKVCKNYNKLTLEIINDRELAVNDSGLILIVYDDATDQIADIAYFATSNGYKISHLY